MTIKDNLKKFFKKNPLDISFETHTITIDCHKLELFDFTIADLLIEKPTEMLDLIKKTIKETEPMLSDTEINIKPINLHNFFLLKEISSTEINKLINIGNDFTIADNKLISVPNLYIEQISSIKQKITKGIFECTACLKLFEVEQNQNTHIIQPSFCNECGGKHFKFLKDESKYTDVQYLTIASDESRRKLKVVLKGKLCSCDDWNVGDYITLTGILTVANEDFLLKALSIEKCELNYDTENLEDTHNLLMKFYNATTKQETFDRNTKEYNLWKNKVLKRDKICQCCGGDKYLEVHHIYNYHDYTDLRTDVENGIVLCKWCHGKFNSYYGHKGTPLNLFRFIRKFGVK